MTQQQIITNNLAKWQAAQQKRIKDAKKRQEAYRLALWNRGIQVVPPKK